MRLEVCKGWKRYKGIRKPSCLGGKGCRACWYVYHKVEQGVTADRAKVDFRWFYHDLGESKVGQT